MAKNARNARKEKLTEAEGPWVRMRNPFEDLRVPTEVEGESMTDASHGNDTDVNNIIARFDRTGLLPPNHGHGQYADVSGLQDDLTVVIKRGKEAMDELQEIQKRAKEAQNQNAKQDNASPSETTSEPPQESEENA